MDHIRGGGTVGQDHTYIQSAESAVNLVRSLAYKSRLLVKPLENGGYPDLPVQWMTDVSRSSKPSRSESILTPGESYQLSFVSVCSLKGFCADIFCLGAPFILQSNTHLSCYC